MAGQAATVQARPRRRSRLQPAGQVARPVAHERPALVQQVTSPVGRLGPVADRVGQGEGGTTTVQVPTALVMATIKTVFDTLYVERNTFLLPPSMSESEEPVV